MPILNFEPGQTSTTYSSGSVNAHAYGNGGSAYGTANYSGVSTTQPSGTLSTSYVPYQVRRDSFQAYFLRKMRVRFGAYYRPLSDELRAKLQRNTGVMVTNLVDGSPAFQADILIGDIILEADGQGVTVDSLQSATYADSGNPHDIVLKVLRGDKILNITVKLLP